MISIRARLQEYGASLKKQWKHDRLNTVGASEIGTCMRKVYFDKSEAPRDPDYIDGWGARLRGNIIEDHFWVPALRATLQEGEQLLFAGEEQRTLVDGYLSATTDGLLVLADGTCVNLDAKSIDPRVDLKKEKEEHSFQVQVQMGIIRHATEYKPVTSILSYVNASFYDDIDEFVGRFDPRVYEAARGRAKRIMTARNALELPPEGKMSGSNECKYCAWASHCASVTVAGVPKEINELPDDAVSELEHLRGIERGLAADKEAIAADHAKAVEQIKDFMRAHKTRMYKGAGWSVSYSVVSGRTTLDTQAVEAAGIDLSSYYKTGSPSERLTVR